LESINQTKKRESTNEKESVKKQLESVEESIEGIISSMSQGSFAVKLSAASELLQKYVNN
jgi:hypothetical protein